MLTNKVMLVVVMIVKAESLFEYRVIDGVNDVNNEFPYVVSLQTWRSISRDKERYRICTGSLIAPEWVLTAAHCLIPVISLVRFGNMTISRNSTDSFRVILKMFPHPNYKEPFNIIKNDIGLILIQAIPMATIGKLSSIDYRTTTGIKVRYAGFGRTGDPLLDESKPLQLGEGVVIQCSHNLLRWGPAICVVSDCSRRHQDSAGGDSGGPVFHDGKIIAIVSGSVTPPEGIYTPVSPYLDWIRDTMITWTMALS